MVGKFIRFIQTSHNGRDLKIILTAMSIVAFIMAIVVPNWQVHGACVGFMLNCFWIWTS